MNKSKQIGPIKKVRGSVWIAHLDDGLIGVEINLKSTNPRFYPEGGVYPMSPDKARELAAVLLQAADEAERMAHKAAQDEPTAPQTGSDLPEPV